MSLRRRQPSTTDGACVSRLATVLHAGRSWHGASPLPIGGRPGRARSPRKPNDYTFYLKRKSGCSDWQLWLWDPGSVQMAQLRADVLREHYLVRDGVEPLSSSVSTQKGFKQSNARHSSIEDLRAHWIREDKQSSVKMKKPMTSVDGTLRVFFFVADFEDVLNQRRECSKGSG